MPQKKIIKGTVVKLQGTDVFHLEPAERKHRGGCGWGEMEGRRRKAETHRQERRSGLGYEERKQEKWRPGGRGREKDEGTSHAPIPTAESF